MDILAAIWFLFNLFSDNSLPLITVKFYLSYLDSSTYNIKIDEKNAE